MEKGAPVDEPELVRRSRRGDRHAFACLVERYWDRLYRWLFHLARDRHQAEDATQETFLKAYSGLPSFKDRFTKDRSTESGFRAWLFRIAYNTFLNQRRAVKRIVAPPEDPISQDAGPEEQAIGRETAQRLADAIARLPAEFRSAFVLRNQEELSFKEIGLILGIAEETARWRLFKARETLLDAMKDEFPPDEP